MGTMTGLVKRVRALVNRDGTERDLDDEIRFHLEQETAKLVRLGMSPGDARRRALLSFGGVTQTKEEHREVRGVRWLEELAADTRFAVRTLIRAPGLATAAILTLALGIGANAAIFSAVNAVILRPLPFPDPDRLWFIGENNPEKDWHMQVAAPANYLDWKEQVPAFQDVAAYSDGFSKPTLSGEGEPRVLHASDVTGNFFSVLGVAADLGRTMRDEETWRGAPPVAVLSHRLWRDVFASDPRVIGHSITLDGVAHQVVGVMPESFAFPSADVELWTPIAFNRADRQKPSFRRAHWVSVIARVRPGVADEQANAQFQAVVKRLQTQYPETNRLMGADAVGLHDYLIGNTRRPLLVLLGAVALLLLIACANVGSLLLVQAAARQREVSLRLALGAGHGRLIKQALTESLLLSALGGLAGLALGWWGTRALSALQPDGMLSVKTFGVDWSVFLFVLGISTASGLLFGLAPALWSGSRAPADTLRQGGRGGSEGRKIRRWGDALVVAEVAIALMLAVGAGLLMRSFWQLQHVDPGFDPRGVLTMRMNLTGQHFDSVAQITRFDAQLVERMRAIPGVQSVGITAQLPLTGQGWTSDFSVQGRPPEDFGIDVAHNEVSPDYFRTMRVPLLRGRAFTDADRRGSDRVVIINDELARSYFKAQDPVGQRISNDKTPDSTSNWATIVGVVGSEHQLGLGMGTRTQIFAPLPQEQRQAITIVLRTNGDPASLAAPARRVVNELDPTLAIINLRPMREVIAGSLARERFLMTMLIVFAVVGLSLAVVGVYGVLAQLTRHRTREMGIRIALGAQTAQVRWLVVSHGLRLVAVGLGMGAGVALLATRAMRGMLFNVPSSDPLTYLSVGLLLALTGVAAAWLPAQRASRADPALALRAD